MNVIDSIRIEKKVQSPITDLYRLSLNYLRFLQKIAELECKTTYAEKKNSTIGNMVNELANEKSEYENALTRRLATMESQLRTQQQKAEDAAIRAAAHAQAPKVGKKKTPSVVVPDAPLVQSAPTQSVDEKRRRLDELARQFRPSIEALFRAELEKIGIKADQRGLTDGMFKMKMDRLPYMILLFLVMKIWLNF